MYATEPKQGLWENIFFIISKNICWQVFEKITKTQIEKYKGSHKYMVQAIRKSEEIFY